MATKTDLEKERSNRVGLMIVFGGSALVWAIFLALMMS